MKDIAGELKGIIAEIDKRKFVEEKAETKRQDRDIQDVDERETKDVVCLQEISLAGAERLCAEYKMQPYRRPKKQHKVLKRLGPFVKYGIDGVAAEAQKGIDRKQVRRDLHQRRKEAEDLLQELLPLCVDNRRLPDKVVQHKERDDAEEKPVADPGRHSGIFVQKGGRRGISKKQEQEPQKELYDAEEPA